VGPIKIYKGNARIDIKSYADYGITSMIIKELQIKDNKVNLLVNFFGACFVL
jgi:hypothetical protein